MSDTEGAVLVTREAWLELLSAAVRPLLPPSFIGRIEINASEGGISNLGVHEFYRPGSVGCATATPAMDDAGRLSVSPRIRVI